MTFIQGINTCSKTLLCICKQTLQPIYSRYTGKALERREIQSFAHLDSINEEDEGLSSLGVRLRRTSFSLTGTLRYYRSKGRKWTWSRNHQTTNFDTSLADGCTFGRNTYSVPKTQAPLAKPLPSTPMSVDPTPQFRYTAPIESKVNVLDVIGQILLRKCASQSRIYWL